ncbi:hypothetical protein F4780DRAFT_287449 [Xylariomycetidae sp. FL0641]|nr:hypothetical protein F4780DRAFT_287449 [Xylariomycetidae sp. FL0641]
MTLFTTPYGNHSKVRRSLAMVGRWFLSRSLLCVDNVLGLIFSNPHDPPGGRTRVYLHPLLASIITDVFQATDHDPAATWQALTTIVLGSAYYRYYWLPAFSRTDTTWFTRVVQRPQPLQHTGFAMVLATVVLQLVTFITVLVLFARRTRYTFLNNAWQAVSQIVSAESISLLVQSTMTLDDDIQDCIDSSGVWGDTDGGKGGPDLTLREGDDGRVFLQH